jgi:hypothetical protein
MASEETEEIQKTPNEHGFLRGGASQVGRRPHRLSIADDAYMRWATRRLPSEYRKTILELHADIWHRTSTVRIGYFHGYILFPTQEDLSTPELHDICDAESQQLMEFAGAIYSAHIDVRQLCDGGEIVFAELLEILPAWRGRGLGISAFRAITSEMSRRHFASICVFQPTPLQFTSPFPTSGVSEDIVRAHRTAKQRLTTLYRKHLRARKLARNSDYYYFRIK